MNLDVGCGKGQYNFFIEDVVGVDVDLPRLKLFYGEKVLASANYLPFRYDRFERVGFFGLLECEGVDWQRCFTEAIRVLKDRGILWMNQPFRVWDSVLGAHFYGVLVVSKP